MRSLTALVLAAIAAPAAAQDADLVLHSGKVYPVAAGQPRAQALAVREGKIVFVGSTAEAMTLAGDETQLIDLAGRPLYPGFIDGHGHLSGFGASLLAVDLVGTASYEDVIRLVVERAAQLPKGAWVLGRGWDQNDWPDKRFPSHEALSAAVPDHPVVMTRIDGHALLANAAAMEAAGVVRGTADPDGGRVIRGADGNASGVFVDNAMSVIHRAVPQTSNERVREGVKLAIAELHRFGVTGMHDAGVPSNYIDLYAEMARLGEFDLRNYIMVAGGDRALERWLQAGPRDDLTGHRRLSVRSIKLSIDGALGSRGAALLEDYADEPGHRGLALISEERVRKTAARALSAGFQLCVHAIGDAANRQVLDAFEAALAARPTADHRFRIEHAQILHPDDLARFAELGVIPSMQAQHQTSDMYWAGDRLGPHRLAGAYAWRSLIDSGVIIPGGSDFPVERPDPIAAYHAAIARQDADNWPSGGWQPQERMTREEALAHLTLWPAVAGFSEDWIGSLEVGKLADMVVLSADLLTLPADKIESAVVDLTIFDGRVVYERDASR